MANTSAIGQQAAHTTYRLPSPAQQEPYKKAQLLTKIAGEFSTNKSGEWTISREMTRQSKRTGRKNERMREAIGQRNQMTALRFQKGGKGGGGNQTFLASLGAG